MVGKHIIVVYSDIAQKRISTLTSVVYRLTYILASVFIVLIHTNTLILALNAYPRKGCVWVGCVWILQKNS